MERKKQTKICEGIDPNHIYELTRTISNNMSLGQEIRRYIWELEKNQTT